MRVLVELDTVLVFSSFEAKDICDGLGVVSDPAVSWVSNEVHGALTAIPMNVHPSGRLSDVLQQTFVAEQIDRGSVIQDDS